MLDCCSFVFICYCLKLLSIRQNNIAHPIYIWDLLINRPVVDCCLLFMHISFDRLLGFPSHLRHYIWFWFVFKSAINMFYLPSTQILISFHLYLCYASWFIELFSFYCPSLYSVVLHISGFPWVAQQLTYSFLSRCDCFVAFFVCHLFAICNDFVTYWFGSNWVD